MDWDNDHDSDHRRHRYSLNSKIMLTAIICLFLVVVVIVALHLYARCVLRRRRDAMRQSGVGTAAAQVNSTERRRTGLDAAVIATLPIFVYKGVGEDETNKDSHVECAVCLSNLEKDEMARLLPNCKHTFHSQCIDTWLAVHSTCPICRTEAKPSDQPDQSVESGVVVPATAPPVVEAINSSLPCSEGTSEEQSSKVGGSSTSRLNSFRRILTRERSDRRLQVNDQTDSARDLERQ